MADNIIDPKDRVISHSWKGENEMLSRKKKKSTKSTYKYGSLIYNGPVWDKLREIS